MSWKATAWAKDTRGHKGLASKVLLLVLADYHDAERGYAWPSQQRLADDCEMSIRTVKYALDWLEQAGFITTLQRGNQHQETHYRLNMETALAQSHAGAISGSATLAPTGEGAIHDMVKVQSTTSEGAIHVGTSLHEPSLEPSQEKRERQARKSVVDEQYIQKKVKEFAFLWAEEQVREHIKDAVGHSAFRKWDDKQRYVSRWLSNAKSSQNGANNGRFGSNPAENLGKPEIYRLPPGQPLLGSKPSTML